MKNFEYRKKSEMIIPRHHENESRNDFQEGSLKRIVVKSELQVNELAEQIRNNLSTKENEMTFNEKTKQKLDVFRKVCKKIPQTELAYMAGFFDGEGSVIAGRSMRGNHKSPMVFIKLGNTDIRPIQFFQKYFGVTIKKQAPEDASYRTKTFYFVAIGEAKSRVFLERLLPYLIVKHRQARLAIDFYNEKLKIGNPFKFKDSEKLFIIRDKIASLNNRNHLAKSS